MDQGDAIASRIKFRVSICGSLNDEHSNGMSDYSSLISQWPERSGTGSIVVADNAFKGRVQVDLLIEAIGGLAASSPEVLNEMNGPGSVPHLVPLVTPAG